MKLAATLGFFGNQPLRNQSFGLGAPVFLRMGKYEVSMTIRHLNNSRIRSTPLNFVIGMHQEPPELYTEQLPTNLPSMVLTSNAAYIGKQWVGYLDMTYDGYLSFSPEQGYVARPEHNGMVTLPYEMVEMSDITCIYVEIWEN